MADGKEAAAKEASLVQQRHDQAMLELQVGSSAQNHQRSTHAAHLSQVVS